MTCLPNVLINAVGTGATILTTSDGAQQIAERGLTPRVIDVTQGYLYTKGR